MATFLDITGLQYFNSLFIFLFSWAILYSVFLLTKILGGNKVLPAFVALLLAILIIVNPIAVGVIETIAPWMGFIFIFLVLLLTAMKFILPAHEESIVAVKSGALLFIILVIIIGIFTRLRADIPEPEEGEGADFTKPVNFFLHPKMLGAALLLVISVFTVALLSTKAAI